MSELRRVVVIGSGPAGAIAARQLVRHGIPTTMLESGTRLPTGFLVRAAGRNLFRRGDALDPSTGSFVASGDPATEWTFNLAPGGLSNQWTGAVPRFGPMDFTDGERLHERYRWPIDYQDLAPYYTEAERLLDLTGTPGDVPALPAGCIALPRDLPKDWRSLTTVARAHGQGFTVLPLADGPPWLVTRRGTAFNSFTNIVARLARNPLFELRLGAHVLQLNWSGARRAIDSVTYVEPATGRQHRLEVAGVVVACGALRSTKLLFDSACPDFPDGIGNERGLLGQFLHDHPKEWWSFIVERALTRLSPAGYLTRQPYDRSEPLLATSWTLGLASPRARDRVLSLTPLKGHRIGVQVFASMRPVPENFVRPHASAKDEHGLPQLEISIAFGADELAAVKTSRDHLLALVAESGFHCAPDPIAPQLAPGSAVHYGGSVRMHRSPEFGVLNEWNRPFAVPNLVVSDASCFTTNTEKNPTLTAMALSARAADRLAADLKSGL